MGPSALALGCACKDLDAATCHGPTPGALHVAHGAEPCPCACHGGPMPDELYAAERAALAAGLPWLDARYSLTAHRDEYTQRACALAEAFIRYRDALAKVESSTGGAS